VVVSSLAGYFLAVDVVDFKTLFLLFLGGYSMVGSSNAYNQWLEKDYDKLMIRTKNRPLPKGRMTDKTAVFFGTILLFIGVITLYYINFRTSFFAAFSIFVYTCLYTPLKRKTPLAVFVGAFPGAIPFMLGWIAATNKFGIESGMLFMIQFIWQFPHFWAIGWLMDDDYKKAGFKMLPSGETDSTTAFQIVFYTLWMILISLIPALHLTGSLMLSIPAAICIAIIGLIMLSFALILMKNKTKIAAKNLVYSSILYITLLQIIFVVDKFIST
jgi:protoheme IX farnesyltransferase